jgi:hypothetical protein
MACVLRLHATPSFPAYATTAHKDVLHAGAVKERGRSDERREGALKCPGPGAIVASVLFW